MTTTTVSPNPKVRGPFECSVPRVIKASPQRLFKAWTDPEKVRPWLTNGGECVLQPHVGGLFFLSMVYNDHSYPHYGRYLQVKPDRLLEFTWMSQGTHGKESIVRVEFEPKGESTKITIHHSGLPDEKERKGHEEGWTEILGWLEKRAAA